MTGAWKPHAYAATVDIAAAHLAKTLLEAQKHLIDAVNNITAAIDAIEEAEDGK